MNLLAELEAEPFRFEFLDVMRRLECAFADRPRLGRSRLPEEDAIRLGQAADLAFATSSLASLTQPQEAPPHLAVRFFGLFGPNGPLPLHLTEYARARAANHGDPTFIQFADLFHHRMLSYFYRAWADAEPCVEFDRPDTDRFAMFVGALFGMSSPANRYRDVVPDLAKLHYAALLACPTRHPEGLEGLLGDFFGLPVGLLNFTGTWVELPDSWKSRLGESPGTGLLGRTITLGGRVWEVQNKFRVALGPLGLADYMSFLPGSPRLARLAALVETYTRGQWDFDVQLILARSTVPATVLDGVSRLGWTTWLGRASAEQDADDLVVVPQTMDSGATGFREADGWPRSAESPSSES